MKSGEMLHVGKYDSKKLELVLPAVPLSPEQETVIRYFIDNYNITITFLEG